MRKLSSSDFATHLRALILEESFRAHVGHIGCSLSIADILAVLYTSVLSIPQPTHPKRDRFILSKGHAALGLYASLYLKGYISASMLHSFHQNGSQLGVHPEYGVPGVELATGSLGQGLSTAVGIALAARIRQEAFRTITLLSDAECNEGSVWEAIMFAGHHRLSSLSMVIDLNGQQGFGYTNDVLSLSPLAEKLQSFGWAVTEVDGHNHQALLTAFQKRTKQPHAIIASTILGKGISFMERKIDWHYLPLTEDLYAQAKRELEL